MQPERTIQIVINKKKFDLQDSTQTGANLKNLAGIPLSDVLFLQRPHEDEVIANETSIEVKNGNHFHSQPPADYGLGSEILTDAGLVPDRTTLHQEGGWTFLVISDYALPVGFTSDRVELLVKLPPGFPDAAPDMFWVHPEIRMANGGVPRATSIERLLGKNWQRFSWHLVGGTWKPGVSTLRDFLRCIYGRFLKQD